MSNKSVDEEQLIEEQLKVYGLMKFPPDFMNIGEKQFYWVFENRPEWVKFSENWKEATGLFKFWYLYVKLRGSLLKNNDQPSERQCPSNSETPVYDLPMADE